MAEWKITGSTFDPGATVEEFVIYEAGDVKREKALRLTQEGKLIAQKIEDANGGAMVPVGAILIWAGDANKIPTGWALCDGRNGTPNLVSYFIRGASATGEPKAETSGWSDEHAHTASATVTINTGGNHAHGMPSDWYSNWADSGRSVTIVDQRASDVAFA